MNDVFAMLSALTPSGDTEPIEVRLLLRGVAPEAVRGVLVTSQHDDGVQVVINASLQPMLACVMGLGWRAQVLSPQWFAERVSAEHRRAAEVDLPMPAVRQGELYWASTRRYPEQQAIPHPYLIVQHDALNQSRVPTAVACGLTSNLKRANEPGCVLLEPGEGGLERQSVVLVSQVCALARRELGAKIGQLSAERVAAVLRGMAFAGR